MKTRSKLSIGVLPTVLLAALIGACNDPDPVPVNVTVRSFSVALDRSTAPDGTVVFRVTNAGQQDVHEVLVIRTDRAPNALPTEANGSYQEDGPGTQVLDELEDIAPGQTKELSMDLAQGNYVLICNIVEVEPDGTVESHYAMGMTAAFRVE